MSKNNERIIKMNRRGFLDRSACASLGATGIVSTLAHLNVMNAFAASQTLGDYKALICIFQGGGCDWNNGLVPMDGHPERANYETHRGYVALPSEDLNAITPDNYTGSEGLVGTHASLPRMASMFNAGDLCFVEGVGTLAYPMSKQQYDNKSVGRPKQLFSHSSQQGQWQATVADQEFSSGWGGNIGKLMTDASHYAAINGDSKVPMLITLSGPKRFLVAPGGRPDQFTVSSDGAVGLVDFGSGYEDAIRPNGTYKPSTAGKRLKYWDMLMNHTSDNYYQEGVNTIYRNARNNEGLLREAVATADALQAQVDFDGNFSGSGDLGDQLKMVAKLIAGRECLGNERQIFFCSYGGWDHHNNLLNGQATRLDGLDRAVDAFNTTMHDLAAADSGFSYGDFIAFSGSDFDRTFKPNGGSGTDHAWGTKVFAFGGDVKGKHLFGTLPNLVAGGDDDAGSKRGRWIPKHSVEQYASVLAKWFGVQTSDLNTVFPNLPRFDAPSASNNLDFINFS